MNNENFKTIIDSDGKEHQILKDKGRTRVPVLLRDAASFCMDCMGKGVWDVGIRCPMCGGSGFLNREGQGVDEVVRATSNKTEGARGGQFGADHSSLSDAEIKMRDHLARDAAWRNSTAGSRPGFHVNHSDARQKYFDAMAAEEEERNNAWKQLRSDAEYTGGPDSRMNVGAGSEARNIGKEKEGGRCSVDGRSGHLQRDANGDLRCVPDRAGSEDRRTLDQVAHDHASRMDAEYKNYETQIGSAYRTLK